MPGSNKLSAAGLENPRPQPHLNFRTSLQPERYDDAGDQKFPIEPSDLSPKQYCIIAWARLILSYDAGPPQSLCRLTGDSVAVAENTQIRADLSTSCANRLALLPDTGFQIRTMRIRHFLASSLLAASLAAGAVTAAGAQVPPPATAALTYADLVGLADQAPLVLRAQVRKQAVVEPERSPGLAPGHVRLYVEARTLALLAGSVPVGESLAYLVDVPLDARGKPPKLGKAEVLLFARPVSGRPGQIQLVEPDAQLPYSAEFESRLRPILAALVAPDAPPRVTGVRDALAVEGTLAGESETQLFLDAENEGSVSITVVHRPNQSPRWGVSWTEIVDQAARPPQRDTLAWYRLACALPAELPAQANLARNRQARALAAKDYAFVIRELGRCKRTRD